MTERTPRTRTTDDTEGSTGRSRRIDRRGDGTAERTRLSRDSNSRSAPTIRSENGRRESEFSTASDFIKTAASLKINSLFGDIEGSETATSYTNDSNTPDLTDPLTLKKLVSQAIIDAEGFSIVTPERYIDQKKRLSQIQSTLLSLQNKLNLEVKVKEASESIIRLGAGDRQEIVEARMKLKASDEKMNEISKDLWVVMGDLIDAERGILKHIAGVLRW
ncbi:Up-regulated during septation-domain-containing protein [Globomyces pollinis-pini]|nr:Up-regulated during septation-domain-containing protein [Globomyces pollinis-pini]